jgi:hypothetical protein
MSTSINIPKPSVRSIEIDLSGLAPGILLNPFARKAETQLLASMQKKKARLARPDKDPDAEYAERLEELRFDDGLWVNLLAFKSAIVRGATSVDKLPMTIVREGLFLEPDGFMGGGFAAVKIMGTPEPFTRRVANKGGAPDLRTRVLVPRWTCTLKALVNETLLSVDQVVTCAVNAGMGCGVGDWRPQKSGVHGRWNVTGVRG